MCGADGEGQAPSLRIFGSSLSKRKAPVPSISGWRLGSNRVRGAAPHLASRWRPYCSSGLPWAAWASGIGLSLGAALSPEFSVHPGQQLPFPPPGFFCPGFGSEGLSRPTPGAHASTWSSLRSPLQLHGWEPSESLVGHPDAAHLLHLGEFAQSPWASLSSSVEWKWGFFCQDVERIRWNVL